MEELLKKSLEASKKYFASVSENRIQEILNELDVCDYEGISIDEFLTCNIELSGFIKYKSSSIKGRIYKPRMRQGVVYQKDFQLLIKEKLYRIYFTETKTKTKKRGQSQSPLFFLHLC